MYKANYHTHTYRCKHAGGTEEDYVKKAIEEGLTVIGFSDHGPYKTLDLGSRMSYEELPDYVQTLDELKIQYQSQITIYKGLEIEYIPSIHKYYEELLTKHGLEYLILGPHDYQTPDGQFHNEYYAPDTASYIDYAHAIVEGLHTGYFKILAHPDLCMLNPYAFDDNCRKAFDIILNAIVDTDIPLEYNANGLRRGITDFPDGARYMYPHQEFWKLVAQTNHPVIIGCDCHNPAYIYDEFVKMAESQLNELGITPIEFLDGFEPKTGGLL